MPKYLTKLKFEFLFADFIRPVCLPTSRGTDDTIFNAAGWGEVISTGRYSDTKKSIHLPLWPKDDCQKIYRNDVIPKLAICAGGQKGIDTCRGDSGGPLTAKRKYIELLGVTSLGPTTCGREGAPGIYTSVWDHLAWINEVIGVT
jgi:secreted trypsin-like serine protease